MARERNKLTDLEIKAAKPGGKVRKLIDGRGLQLWVMPNGGKYWRFEYRHLGKRKLLALGVYPDLTLEKARQRVDEARRLLADEEDPSEVKRVKKAEKKLAAENTFMAIAEKLTAKKRKDGRAGVTIGKMEWILGKLKSSLGPRPIAAIRTPEIIQALKKEEDADNLETARRMRTVIGEVFRFAMQHGIVESDPSAATRGSRSQPQAETPPGDHGYQETQRPDPLDRRLRNASSNHRQCSTPDATPLSPSGRTTASKVERIRS